MNLEEAMIIKEHSKHIKKLIIRQCNHFNNTDLQPEEINILKDFPSLE